MLCEYQVQVELYATCLSISCLNQTITLSTLHTASAVKEPKRQVLFPQMSLMLAWLPTQHRLLKYRVLLRKLRLASIPIVAVEAVLVLRELAGTELSRIA